MIAIHSSLYLVIIANDVDLSKIRNVKEIDLKVERLESLLFLPFPQRMD